MTTQTIQKRVQEATERLIAALEAGQSDALKDFIRSLGRFHRYSFGNTLLIHMQRPDATRVAGFAAWRQLKRSVRKGEKSIVIMAPVVRRYKDASGGEKAGRLMGFKAAHVFDLSQTTGEPLAEMPRTSGSPGDRLDRLRQFAAAKGITVDSSDSMGTIQGASLGGQILLRRGLAPAEEFSTLAHELAHEMLHRGPDRASLSRTVKETQAEAVAHVVCEAAGLDCGTAGSDYIQLYQGDRKTLLESLRGIQAAASEIIGAILPDETAPKQPTTAQECPPMASAA